jgi:hypothetical protein
VVESGVEVNQGALAHFVGGGRDGLAEQHGGGD